MKPAPLIFTEIAVERMPGFPRWGPHLRELAAGVNVIYGPNASGKSTTARALLALLWPASAPPRSLLAGRYEIGGESFQVKVEHDSFSCRRDGAEAPPPTLPPAESRERYYLPLDGLLAADESSRRGAGELAAAIHREAAGGYDLAAAVRAAGLREAPSRSQIKPAVELRQAERAVADERARQEELRAAEERLVELGEQRRQASSARERLATLDQALEHARADERVRQAEHRLGTFPNAMEKLRGDELERLARLRERGSELARRRRQAEGRIADERQRITDSRLPAEGLPPGLVEGLRGRLEALRDAGQAAETAWAQAAEARAQARQALERVDPDGDLETWRRQAGPAPARELAPLLRQAEGLRAREALREQARAVLGPAPAPEELAPLEEGARLLRRWLAAPALPWPSRLVLLAVAALLLAGGTLAWRLGHGLWPPALAALGGLALLLLAWRPGPGGGRRSTYRRDFEATGLAPPPAWRPRQVELRLEELTRRLEEGRRSRLRGELWSALAVDEAELDRRRRELEASRGELARELGLAPGVETLELVWLAEALRRLDEALSRLAAAEAAAAAAEANRAELARGLAADLAAYGYTCPPQRETLQGAVEDLAGRQRVFAQARDALAREERLLADELEPDRVEHERQRQELFSRLGLAVGDEATLDRWIHDLPDFQKTADDLRLAGRDREQAAAALEAHPELLRRSPAELEEERDRCQEVVDRWQSSYAESIGIQTLVDQAKKGHGLEAALAHRDACREALRQAREADYEAVAGWVLGEHLRGRSQDRDRSPVLRRARERFAGITRERYELRIEGGDPPSFRALDTVAGEARSLDELSSGTRVQLLLAVRMAFIETQERGVALPLILDEALANSDDQRARAVIEALVELAREGRQILAFTAQPEEAGKWTAVLEALAAAGRGVEHRTFDLGTAARVAEARRLPLRIQPPVGRPAVPPPEGRSHGEYGRALGVPGIDPRAEDPGGVHLWHLLEDPETLYAFLDAGFERWGQARGLLEAGGAEIVPGGEEALAPAAAAARALGEALRLRRLGRGKPVDRAVLAESGAVSPTFLDGMTTAAERLGGDARRLLEALEARELEEVKGFRSAKIEELQAYLADGGYLPRGEPLAPEELRARVLAAAAGDLAAGRLTVEQVDRLLARLPEDGTSPSPHSP